MGSGPRACSPCPSSAAACGCSPAAACPASAAGAAAAAAAPPEPLPVWCARLSSDCACQRALRRCSSSVPGRGKRDRACMCEEHANVGWAGCQQQKSS